MDLSKLDVPEEVTNSPNKIEIELANLQAQAKLEFEKEDYFS